MKLIKIKEEHYVVVDDLQISIGDWIYEEGEIFQAKIGEFYCKKITHSTQPLAPIKELMEKGYDNILPLDIDEIKELIGEVDVDMEKKAQQASDELILSSKAEETFRDVSEIMNLTYKDLYKQGYNQAIEDNKDKKYTEEDMIKCWKYASMDKHQIFGDQIGEYYLSFIKSLQPKTEWEVEIINGKFKIK